MKIDIHVHTRKCKKGDALTREVTPDQFRKSVLETEVGIIAITNHNVFDLKQYESLRSCVENEVQVWPGVEFDVKENVKTSHLIVVVSPKSAAAFYTIVNRLTIGSTPDIFSITLSDIVSEFDAMGPIYIAHHNKSPKISDENLESLVASTKHKNRVIKEVTNAISAGIYISHGAASIYGSDLHDWSKYKEEAANLPELRLPVQSFEQFFLLLDKNTATINTMLDRKSPEIITISPFDDGEKLSLKVYDDINVFFGSKGTGKSCILKAIAQHFAKKGIDAAVYAPGEDLLDKTFGIKVRDITLNLEPYGIKYCTDEIKNLRTATDKDVTSLKRYCNHFNGAITSANSKRIKLQNLITEQSRAPARAFEDHNTIAKLVSDFQKIIQTNKVIENVSSIEQLQQLLKGIETLLSRIELGKWNTFTTWKEIALLNSCITSIKDNVQRKTGAPALPVSTGFRDYALNRLKIEHMAKTILENSGKPIPIHDQPIGILGGDKGALIFRAEYRFQDGSITDATFQPTPGIKKGAQKQFIGVIRDIVDNAYSTDLFEQIAKITNDEDFDGIKTVNELLLVRKGYFLDGISYVPSSGEKSMLMLHRELAQDKEVYLLDEPERSLGNDYINDVIVPLIKDKARCNKKIFISTHDANIAVRTLPSCSIFRKYGANGYETFVGNPFSNDLINIVDINARLDWKKISMKTLEGGEEAFGRLLLGSRLITIDYLIVLITTFMLYVSIVE